MFEPPVLTVSGLQWQPAAHGPEPDAVLMAHARLNGVPFVLHAFRTAMPYASGWTERISWEDDKGMLGTGILWRMETVREHVQVVDSGASSLLLEHISLEEDEIEWEGRWLMLSRLLASGAGEWMPATIGKSRYHIVGTPVAVDRGVSGPSWKVGPEHMRGGGHQGTPRIGMRIEGGACDLGLLRVRAIGGRMQPVHAELQPVMGSMLSMIGILDGHPHPMPMGDGYWLPMLVPGMLDDWSLDEDRMLSEMRGKLELGSACWFPAICTKRFDAFDARVVEGIAEACRMGNLALKDGRVWISQSMEDLFGRLAFGRGDDETRSRLFRLMSKTLLRGVRVDAEGMPHLIRSRLADRVYLFDDSLLAQIGDEFANLAPQCAPGEFLRLPWKTTLYRGTFGEPGTPSAWSGRLPALLDRKIDRFLREWQD